MKRIKLIIIVGLLVTGACSDYLEEESQDEVIVRTVTDFSELLLGSGYPKSYSYMASELYLLDDDVEINESVFRGETENTSIVKRFGHFTWQPDMWERTSLLTETYSKMYAYLMGINATLDYIDDAIGDAEERDQVKAEALGLRGYLYYMLVNLYGEPYNYNKKALGVPLKLVSDLKENGLKRNTVEEVYNQIVTDLRASSKLFEKYPKRRGNYRINGPAVNILLSRVYLYMEQWDSAIVRSDRAIAYAEGLTDYTKITDDFAYLSYGNQEVEWLYGAGRANYAATIQNECRPSTDLISKFHERDVRLEMWFAADKIGIYKKNQIGPGPVNTIRISEAYLNRAEAYVQKGEHEKALADLNELRRHRIRGYQGVNISNQALLLDEVRLERRLELCFDEQRWFDLRRYGMPSISHLYKSRKSDPWLKYTLTEKDPLYTIPLPRTVFVRNGKLEQNASALEPIRQGYRVN